VLEINMTDQSGALGHTSNRSAKVRVQPVKKTEGEKDATSVKTDDTATGIQDTPTDEKDGGTWSNPAKPEVSTEIGDLAFINQLNQLIALRSFLIKQAIRLTSCRSLGLLNTLHFKSGGRFPTPAEWSELENHTELLFVLLSEPLRRKFLSSQIPRWVTTTAISLGGLAIIAFIAAFINAYAVTSFGPIISFLVWVAALGALGSIAFIGMNALAVQDDATFDLTNDKLIILRIVLGALFGMVLTLPFGYHHFLQFIREIASSNPDAAEKTNTELLQQAVALLLPFILGFSTNLVIMILNRFVESVQSFFARSPPPPPAPARVGAQETN
jgi:hypothetical protein